MKRDIGKNANENWEYEFVKLEEFAVRICQQVMRGRLVKDENLSTNVLKLLRDMDNAGFKLSKEDYECLI